MPAPSYSDTVAYFYSALDSCKGVQGGYRKGARQWPARGYSSAGKFGDSGWLSRLNFFRARQRAFKRNGGALQEKSGMPRARYANLVTADLQAVHEHVSLVRA